MKSSLISFIGNNDAGKKVNNQQIDGAILTVLKERKFNEIHLLWNPTVENEKNYYKIGLYVKSEIIKRMYCKEENIHLHSFECNNVADHNEIYPKLLNFCKLLPKNIEYTAAIASGTPSMQVCWILMAESKDFSIKLIRSNEPKYNRPVVQEVKLETGLPRIEKMQKEIDFWTHEYIKSLPNLCINLKKRKIRIGDLELNLSPIEFSYYLYFTERAKKKMDFLEFSDSALMPEVFSKKILQFHTELFPAADSNRMDLEKKKSIHTSVFRSNINKLNNKVKAILENEKQDRFFLVISKGKRFYKSYGIELPKEKIIITKN